MKPAERLYARASRALADGDLALALEIATRLVERSPRFAPGHALAGAAHQQRRDFTAAAAAYARARDLAPDAPAVHNNRGRARREAGETAASVAALREAVRLRPSYWVAHNTLGLSLQAAGDAEGALASFRASLAAKPDYGRARHNLGNALRRRGERAEGTALLREAVAREPLYAEAWNSLGAALREDGHLEEAEDALRRALHVRPRYPKALLNLAQLHADLERPAEALAGYREALALDPGYPKALVGVSAVLQRAGRLPEALQAADAAVGRAPGSGEAHLQRGAVLRAMGRMADALAAYERAVESDDALDAARAARLELRAEQCDWRERDADVSRLRAASAAALARGHVPPLTASAAHRFVPCTPDEQQALARDASRRLAARLAPLRASLGLAHAARARERLRVGYLSCDFRNNAVGHLTRGLFRAHDRARVEAFAYSYGPDDGSVYRRTVEADAEHFVDVAALSHADAARRIHADEIDVLVDLVGGAGNGRPEILALRPAPVQVHFLGYPATVGAALVDAFVGDRVTIPDGAERFFDEAVVRLPDAYQLNDGRQEIASEAPGRGEFGLPDDAFVFACFNASYKIEPEVFDDWMRVLARVPRSVLWLLATAPATGVNLRREAAACGVDPSRLVFAAMTDKPRHLARHRLAQLFLDTPLCNAHTTASDALWAGLPVLTRPGESFASRVGASLLAAAGLPELSVRDRAEYVETAVRLAEDARALAALTARLRADPGRLPLFDTARTVRALERAYATMWDRHLRGEPAGGFDVAPD
ncbi:MAG: tetratricopeptide repeat protein [Vicinamibacteria bacterium]